MIIRETLPTKSDLFSENKWSKERKIEYFENQLISTNRQGMQNVINFLHSPDCDFYTAPSSTIYHCNYEGGLLDHSLNVFSTAVRMTDSFVKMDPSVINTITDDNLSICCLLHDFCKINFYRKQLKFRKVDSSYGPQWEKYIGYEVEDRMPLGHGEKSVIMLSFLGLTMTLPEMLAIRYHMGPWDNSQDNKTRNAALNGCPLISILQSADFTASLVFEEIVTAPAVK